MNNLGGEFEVSDSVSVSVSVVGGEGGGFGRSVVCDRFLCTFLSMPPTWALGSRVATTDAIQSGAQNARGWWGMMS